MGCDIHPHLEVKKKGRWRPALPAEPSRYCVDGEWPTIWRDRNYFVFAMLAGVRNQHNITPIDEPRGLPDDLCDEYQEGIHCEPPETLYGVIDASRADDHATVKDRVDKALEHAKSSQDAPALLRIEAVAATLLDKGARASYDASLPDPVPRASFGDHSQSWLGLDELLAYDWTKVCEDTGVVDLHAYAQWKDDLDFATRYRGIESSDDCLPPWPRISTRVVAGFYGGDATQANRAIQAVMAAVEIRRDDVFSSGRLTIAPRGSVCSSTSRPTITNAAADEIVETIATEWSVTHKASGLWHRADQSVLNKILAIRVPLRPDMLEPRTPFLVSATSTQQPTRADLHTSITWHTSYRKVARQFLSTMLTTMLHIKSKEKVPFSSVRMVFGFDS